MDTRISRRLMIGEKEVLVLDGLFSNSDVLSLYEFLNRLPYRLDDIDSDKTAYSKHWKAELPISMVSGNALFRRCVDLTHELMTSGTFRLNRVHANLHLHGDMQFPHVDLRGGVTALYYANAEWDEKWLGETVFYDEHRDPLYAVGPLPGRLVIFHADIVHRAGVPSRECYAPRISVAFKFSPV